MKKLACLFFILPIAFVLGGCSHVHQLKNHTNFATHEVIGKSGANYVYYKDGHEQDRVKVEDKEFPIELPREQFSRTILISGNKDLSSAKKINIPSSKPLCSWSEFVEEFDDAELMSNGENNGPKIPSRLKNIKDGTYHAIIRNYQFTFWLSKGNLMALRIKGDYPIKRFSYMVGIAASGAGVAYDMAEDKVSNLLLDPGQAVKSKRGDLEDSVKYHESNVYGKLTFEIYK
mgnify:FL=1